MSKVGTSSLAPSPAARDGLDTVTQVSTGLYDFAKSFDAPPGAQANIPPEYQNLFLRGLAPYSEFCGQKAMALVYAVTELTSTVVNTSFKMRDFTTYVAPHLDDLRGGFHPIVHVRTKLKLHSACSELHAVVKSSKALVAQFDAFHTQLDQFISELNREIEILTHDSAQYKTATTKAILDWDNQLQRAWLSGQINYWAYCYELCRLTETSDFVQKQAEVMQNPTFQKVILKRILATLDAYKKRSKGMAQKLTEMDTTWTQLADQADELSSDVHTFTGSLPNSLKVLTKIDLQNIESDWQEMYDKAVKAETSMDSSVKGQDS